MRSRTADRQLLAFGKRLRAARLVAGYENASDFARDLGLEEPRYRRYERGEAWPPIDILVHAAHLTGKSIDFLCGAIPSDDPNAGK